LDHVTNRARCLTASSYPSRPSSVGRSASPSTPVSGEVLVYEIVVAGPAANKAAQANGPSSLKLLALLLIRRSSILAG